MNSNQANQSQSPGGGEPAEEPLKTFSKEAEPPIDASLESHASAFELLNYYKQRVTSYEEEQKTYHQSLSAVEVSHAELHKVKWDLRVRREEVTELQKAMGDVNMQLFDERAQVLKLAAENEQLRIQELEDRRRIQHLLALTQPVTQEVTFFRDCRPSKMTRFPTQKSTRYLDGDSLREQADGITWDEDHPATEEDATDDSQEHSRSRCRRSNQSQSTSQRRTPPKGPPSYQSAKASARHKDFSSSSSSSSSSRSRSTRSNSSSSSKVPSPQEQQRLSKRTPPSQPSQILRTVYLPSEHADTLIMTVESLKTQLEEQKNLASAMKQQMLSDKAELRGQLDKHLKESAQRETEMSEQLERQQRKLIATTKDYLALRHHSLVMQRQATEQIEGLKSSNTQLAAVKEYALSTVEAEKQIVREKAMSDSQHFVRHFRDEAQNNEQDYLLLKEQYESHQRVAGKRIKDLQKKLKTLREKHHRLETKRNLEFEGFSTDTRELRKRLAQLEQLYLGRKAVAGDGFSDKPSSHELRNEMRQLQARYAEINREVAMQQHMSMKKQ